MLDHLPFIPGRIETQDSLLLIPFCHNRRQWDEYRGQALKQQPFLGAQILHFQTHTLITGFMGYPHLLTLLAGIGNWREKELYWLGTAGSLVEGSLPDISSVSDVVMTPELQESWGSERLSMKKVEGVPARSVVTVDVPHRETPSWLDRMRQKDLERVEMELFPLRFMYGRPFTALLVGSDRVGADKRAAAVPYKRLVESFSDAFISILELIHET